MLPPQGAARPSFRQARGLPNTWPPTWAASPLPHPAPKRGDSHRYNVLRSGKGATSDCFVCCCVLRALNSGWTFLVRRHRGQNAGFYWTLNRGLNPRIPSRTNCPTRCLDKPQAHSEDAGGRDFCPRTDLLGHIVITSQDIPSATSTAPSEPRPARGAPAARPDGDPDTEHGHANGPVRFVTAAQSPAHDERSENSCCSCF